MTVACPSDEIENTGISASLLAGALRLWSNLDGAKFELINHTENATFLVQTPHGEKTILRVHREGYNSQAAIDSELAWSKALRTDTALVTPLPIAGNNALWVQVADLGGREPQFMVLFEFEVGHEPSVGTELPNYFEKLGVMAATAHNHAKRWQRPKDFERLVWTAERILDENGLWGDWRTAPGMTYEIRPLFDRLDKTLRTRLEVFGQGRDRFGLIHADMRLANLLVEKNQIKLIDFDDCGFCWYMYDFAAAISFIEDSEQVPELRRRWLKGYRTIGSVSEEDERELETFIMLRRMALTAWIGSHSETPFAASLAETFVPTGARLAEAYLQKFG